LLSEHQPDDFSFSGRLAVVREHFRTLKPKRALLAELVIHRLAARSLPARRFVAGREAALAADLVRTLRAVVYASEQYTEWSQGLQKLGRSHAASGATVEHYLEFKAVFLATLGEMEGEVWNDSETSRAWGAFFDMAIGHLVRSVVGVRISMAA
jgi:hypothetical protein